jgi:transcription antitermination factor NusA-like protein
MAVDNPDVVDIVSVDASGCVVLTISDHLEWIDSVRHQSMLQAKINRYLAFVESDEILVKYPDARDREIIVRVVVQHEPDSEAIRFFQRVEGALADAGLRFTWHQLSANAP